MATLSSLPTVLSSIPPSRRSPVLRDCVDREEEAEVEEEEEEEEEEEYCGPANILPK